MITLQDILIDWKKDSQIDRTKILEESLRISRLHSKYIEILAGVKMAYKRKKKKLENLRHNKKLWMSGRLTQMQMDTFGWKYDPFDGHAKPLKGELDGYISNEPDVVALKEELDELEICRDTVMEIVNKINWRGQDLRIAVDWAKFEAGA